MAQAVVSKKYQITIPKNIRGQLGIHPGQRLSCVATGRIIYLVPFKPLKRLRGMAQGVSLKEYREKKDPV